MAKPNYAFEKRQRELAKKRKKEEKLARKAQPRGEGGEAPEGADAEEGAPAQESGETAATSGGTPSAATPA